MGCGEGGGIKLAPSNFILVVVISVILPKRRTPNFPLLSATFLHTHNDSEILEWVLVDSIVQHAGEIRIIGKPYSHSLFSRSFIKMLNKAKHSLKC